jgi:hypothetical protein
LLTVAEKHENDEVEGVDHPVVVNASLGYDPQVHQFVPILSCQDLQLKTPILLMKCPGSNILQKK